MEPQEQSNEPTTQVPVQKSTPRITTATAIITAAVIIAVVLIIKMPGGSNVAGTKANAPSAQEITSVDTSIATVRPTDHVFNDATTASVIAIEYSDSDCPFCQQFHGTMKQILSSYGTKVAWVYRYFPLSIHPNTKNEALALECASQIGGNSAFWKYLDSAFSVTVDPAQSNSILTGFAKAQGLDENLFATCLKADSTSKRVQSDADEAASIGAQGTPFTILVNKAGKQVILPGAYPLEDVKKAIDSLMK